MERLSLKGDIITDMADRAAGTGGMGKSAVLFLGMHRGGTSAIAGVFSRLGVDLGSDLIAASDDNPKGYFEHQRIVSLHDEILAVLDSRWDDPRPLPARWERDPLVAPLRDRLRTILATEFSGRPLWGFKDPRLCRLLPLWLPLLNELRVRPAFILAIRHPADVARSLRKRNSMSLEHSSMLWLSHIVSAVQNTRGRPRTALFYDDLLTDWRGEIARIQRELGIDLRAFSGAATHEVEEFLSADLRRQSGSPTIAVDAPQNLHVTSVYDALRSWRQGETLREDVFDKAERALVDAEASTRPVADFFLSRANSVIREANELVGSARADIARREADTQRIRHEAQAEVDRLRQVADAARAEAGALRAEAEALRTKMAAARVEADAARARCASVQADSARAKSEAVAAHTEASSARSEADAALIIRAEALAARQAAEAQRSAIAAYAGALQIELSAMKASTSWRLGAPARRLLERSSKLHLMRRVVGRTMALPLQPFSSGRAATERRKLAEAAALVAAGQFDPAWYVEQYPDVIAAGLDPVVHYLEHGRAEGREPRRPQSAAVPPVDSPTPEVRLPSAEIETDGNMATAVQSLRQRFAYLEPIPTYSVPDATPSVTVVTDSINAGHLFGGVATAIILATQMATRLDFNLRILTRLDLADPANLRAVLSANEVEWNRNIEFQFAPVDGSRAIAVAPRDLFLTTSWWTTTAMRRAVRPENVVCLVQEDERMFYPHGDDRLRCQEILSDTAIRMVVNSKLLFEHFRDGPEPLVGLADRGVWFEPAFPGAPTGYRDVDAPDAKRRLFFYARPNNLRNLYWRGLEVINASIEEGLFDPAEWDVFFVGKDLQPIELALGVRPHLRQNLAWADYKALVQQMDVALCLMDTPHPSYPPLDLAAAGAVVVTNQAGGKTKLDQYSHSILCVPPSLQDLKQGLRDAVALSPKRSERQSSLTGLVARDWPSALAPVLDGSFLARV